MSSQGVSSGGPAAVRVICDVATGNDGTPRVAVTLDIASWIVGIDHAKLDCQHIASMTRRIREPSGAWAPGSALDLPEEVVPVAWPSMPDRELRADTRNRELRGLTLCVNLTEMKFTLSRL